MRIKIKPSDKWFSRCIRERTSWTCEVCGSSHEEGSQGLHCSHYFGRRAKSLRWAKDNAFAMCFGCHQKLGSNPDDFREWVSAKIGEGMIQILREKREDIGLAKLFKKNEKEVSKHYKNEYESMLEKRNAGETGRIEFEDYL